jgi:hypothetical protein
MQMRDMRNLWSYPYLTREQKQRHDIDERRHLRYDQHTNAMFFIIRRSGAPEAGGVGKFAACEKTLNWLDRMVKREKITIAYMVFVENFYSLQPSVVYYSTVKMALDKLDRVPPRISDDGNCYWWVDDEGEAAINRGGLIGQPLDRLPF